VAARKHQNVRVAQDTTYQKYRTGRHQAACSAAGGQKISANQRKHIENVVKAWRQYLVARIKHKRDRTARQRATPHSEGKSWQQKLKNWKNINASKKKKQA